MNAPMTFYLETERLILRELRPEDAEAMFELDSDPEVHRYLGNKPIQNLQQAKDVIDLVRQQYKDNQIGRWATIEKSSGNFIGWSGLKYIRTVENQRSHFYDVGYRLIPKYWGKGYATESAKAALEYGFTVFKPDEIIGTANEENKASRRALEKCGLKYLEKHMWQDIPCDWLTITKHDWEKIREKEGSVLLNKRSSNEI